MRRVLGAAFVAALFGLAGCHTCDVCDDCGDGTGRGCGCGSRSYHAKVYGDPGYAPGYVAPVMANAGKSATQGDVQPAPALARTPQSSSGAVR